MHHGVWRRAASVTVTAALAVSAFSAPALSSVPSQPLAQPRPAAPAATEWCVAGSFQGWNNASDALNDAGNAGDLMPGDGVHSLDYVVAAAGRYEFKIVECGNWGNASPAQNSWFITSQANQKVKFTIDTADHTGDAGHVMWPKTRIVNVLGDTLPTDFTAVGDWQGWNNTNPDTKLAYLGRGLYRLEYVVPNAGNYSGKIVTTGDWGQQFTNEGRVNGDGGVVNFSTAAPNDTLVILLDTNTGRISFTKHGAPAGGTNWCVAGSFQGWDNASFQLNDAGANGDALGGDGVHSASYVVSAAGRYEFKAVECGNWGNAYPGQNAWFVTAQADQTVRFTFDTNNHAADAGLKLVPAANIVNVFDQESGSFTAVGSFQGWNNSDPATLMGYVGGGLWYLAYPVATPGAYIGKVTVTGAWDGFGGDGRSADAQNLSFNTYQPNAVVRFLLDGTNGRLTVYAPPAMIPGQDGVVFVDDLYHDSRDNLYRQPAGAVTAGTPVKLRMRSAKNDLTEARVQVLNKVTNQSQTHAMKRIGQDATGTYDLWEAAVSAASPTLLFYRFIARDGAASAVYEDDQNRNAQPWLKGGPGRALGAQGNAPYQITVYAADYTTPDWLRNGIMYQIFTDRFRNGDASNDPAPGGFFYDEAGTILRSNQDDWNAIVCDPRNQQAPTCPNIYSQNFYGGDLQGVVDKLDYLHDLGITILYLNPIFQSPSNHKYDTTDFTRIDPMFGDMNTWIALVQGANARGMKIVLDGVFNHSSSDSIYFDRYHRYADSGACESQASPFRAWYYFTTSPDGPCAGPANYESWFGFNSLPKLKAGNPGVRDYFIHSPNAIGAYWILQGASGWRFDVGGDIDPGRGNDPANNYWELLRARIRAINPQSAMLIEEWNDESAWLLGNEMDGGMNYRQRKALIGFVRDVTYTDNDNNGDNTIHALTPSQLEASLRVLYEDYPAQSVQAMMNLLGSHDTNRLRYVLKEYGATDLDKAETDKRQHMLIALLYGLAGSPTTYYADEVGASAEAVGGQDDPYNRLPFPWEDASGSYNAFDHDMHAFYSALGAARNAHPAMRTGAYVPLKADDAAKVFAYGRRTADDAGVVVLNRGAQQTVVIDIPGTFLGNGASLRDAISGQTYAVADGKLTLPDLPQNSAAYLVIEAGQDLTAPDAPAITAAKGNGNVTVNITGAGDKYRVYRSAASGGGYTQIGETAAPPFVDAAATNARKWCYVVTALDASGNESAWSNEACANPFAPFNFVWGLSPKTATHTVGVEPTEAFASNVRSMGVTDAPGQGPNIIAQIGYGLSGTARSTWTWMPASYAGDGANGLFDVYSATLRPEAPGVYQLDMRYSPDGGVIEWHHTHVSDRGYATLVVEPSADATPPDAPSNLRLTNWSPQSIALAWDGSAAGDVHAYDVLRGPEGAAPTTRVGRALAPTTTFADNDVVSGRTYCYAIVARDTSFNTSDPSNTVCQRAEQRMVQMRFTVTVPAFTPQGDTLYMPGDTASILGTTWNPGHLPLTRIDATTWGITLTAPDGAAFQYKYTRGSWDKVEWWGGITGVNNRSITANYGATGVQAVSDDVGNWRDPIVTSSSPADGATGVPVGAALTFTMSRDIAAASVASDTVVVTQLPGGSAVAGTYAVAGGVITFTPDAALAPNTLYRVRFTSGVRGTDNDNAGVQGAPTFTFTTAP